jgi:hypothetical protein
MSVGQRRRLNGLFRPLDAKARALIALRSWKHGAKPDPAIGSTMAPEDRTEFRRLLCLVRAANQLAPYIILLQSYVAELNYLDKLISTRRALGDDIRAIGCFIRASIPEPIIESEYERRTQELRTELVPVPSLAEIAVEHYTGWSDADYENKGGRRVLIDAAWERARGEVEHDLIELFLEGTLTGEINNGVVCISAGSFFHWFGDPQPVLSEAGNEYEVLPDSHADEVAGRQLTRRMLERLIFTAPGGGELPLKLESDLPDVSEETAYAVVERMDVETLRDGVRERWRELRAFEMVVAELAAKEFYGEDLLNIEFRRTLQEIRDQLLILAASVRTYAGDVTLPEPNPTDIAILREMISRWASRR